MTGEHAELLRTDDGSTSWHRAVEGLTAINASAAAISAAGERLALGTLQGQVFVSTTAGRQWTIGGQGLSHVVTSLVFDPSNPLVLYAATADAGRAALFFKSVDGGLTFFPLTTPMSGGGATLERGARLFHPTPHLVVAASRSLLASSLNAGSSWSTHQTHTGGSPPEPVTPLDCFSAGPGTVRLLGSGGVPTSLFSSIDLGLNWAVLPGPSSLRETTVLAGTSSALYAPTLTTFLAWRAGTWTTAEVNLRIPPNRFGGRHPVTAVTAAAPDLVLAATPYSLHASLDGASTWSNFAPPSLPTVLAASADARFGLIGFDGDGAFVLRR